MINLEWYRTFKEIYENETLTKAAVALYASQPGVSVHLSALEAYVGKKLFERTARKMIPTEDGKLLYEYITDAIRTLEVAEQHFKKTTLEKQPSLNIGMCSEMFQLILEPEVPTLPFDLVARFGGYQELINDLSNGILDLVITPKESDGRKSLIEYTPFSKEQIILVAGGETDISDLTRFIHAEDWGSLSEELLTHTWYSASNDMEHFRRFWFENFNQKPSFKPNYILPNLSSIIRCLKNSTGLAVIPHFLCQQEIENNEIVVVWEGKASIENTLYFAKRSGLANNKECEAVQKIFCTKMDQL